MNKINLETELRDATKISTKNYQILFKNIIAYLSNLEKFDPLSARSLIEQLFPKAWQHRRFIFRHYFGPHSIAKQNTNLFAYCFKNEAEAKEYLIFVKLLAADKDLDLLNSVTTSTDYEGRYRCCFTSEQHKFLQDLRAPDSLIKSVRWDPYCYINDFNLSITKTKKNQHNKNLRVGKHNNYTVYGHGFFPRTKKVSPYSVCSSNSSKLIAKKEKTSKHQSTSLVTQDALSSVFGFTKDRRSKLVGFIFDLNDAMLNRLFIYDGGTINRPYEFINEENAKKYFNEKTKSAESILFPVFEIDLFKKAIGKPGEYNEVLARIRWNINTSSIGIFSDTFESRCIAQCYARLLEERLREQFLELNLPWDNSYHVPIVYYLPDVINAQEMNWKIYTLDQQKDDQHEADRILQNATVREQAFVEKNFEFLLLISKSEDALKLTFKNIPVLLHLINEGHFEFAKILYERTSSHQNKVKFSQYLEQAIEQSKAYLSALTLNKINETGDTSLHIAAQTGNVEMVKLLLKLHANHVNDKREDQQTPLHLAAVNGHLETVKALLDKGADPNLPDKKNWTPLHMAAGNNHAEIVKLLIDNGGNSALKDELSWTSLHRATSNGQIEAIKALLAKGANIDALDDSGKSPLYWALLCHNNAVIKLLLDNHANSALALCLAMQDFETSGSNTLVAELYNRGVTINQLDEQHNSVLHWAVMNEYVSVVKSLLAQNVAINFKNNNGKTALHLIADTAGYDTFNSGRISEMLLQYPEIIDEQDNNGMTALHYASKQNNLHIIEKIITHQANINLHNNNNKTALHISAYSGHINITELLLKNGAACHLQDKNGRTALHLAVSRNQTDIVKILVEHDSSMIDLQDKNGSTALHLAINQGHLEIIQILLAKHPNTELKDKKNKTVLQRVKNLDDDDQQEIMDLFNNNDRSIAPSPTP